MNDQGVREMNQQEIAKENRAKLLSYITNNPGLHVPELGRRLKLSKRQMRNAISTLEKEKKIFFEYVGRYKLLFPMSMKGEWRPKFLNPKMREIAEIIRNDPGITSQDIAEKKGVKRQTVLYHLKKLKEMGIIKVKVREGWHQFYWTGEENLEIHVNPTLNVIRVKEKKGRGRPYTEKNHPSRILKFITENPGVHFREIMRRLGISSGHGFDNSLERLERNKEIVSRYDGIWKRFYPATMKEIPKSPLSPSAKKVCVVIDKNPGWNLTELAENFGVTREAIRYHTKNLVESGHIRREWDGQTLIFFIEER